MGQCALPDSRFITLSKGHASAMSDQPPGLPEDPSRLLSTPGGALPATPSKPPPMTPGNADPSVSLTSRHTQCPGPARHAAGVNFGTDYMSTVSNPLGAKANRHMSRLVGRVGTAPDPRGHPAWAPWGGGQAAGPPHPTPESPGGFVRPRPHPSKPGALLSLATHPCCSSHPPLGTHWALPRLGWKSSNTA